MLSLRKISLHLEQPDRAAGLHLPAPSLEALDVHKNVIRTLPHNIGKLRCCRSSTSPRIGSPSCRHPSASSPRPPALRRPQPAREAVHRAGAAGHRRDPPLLRLLTLQGRRGRRRRNGRRGQKGQEGQEGQGQGGAHSRPLFGRCRPQPPPRPTAGRAQPPRLGGTRGRHHAIQLRRRELHRRRGQRRRRDVGGGRGVRAYRALQHAGRRHRAPREADQRRL